MAPIVSHAPIQFFPRDSVLGFFQINEYTVNALSLDVLLCIFSMSCGFFIDESKLFFTYAPYIYDAHDVSQSILMHALIIASCCVAWHAQRIAEMVQNCTTCRIHYNDVAEPLLPTMLPTRPWEHVCNDLFYCKQRWYLLLVDYYSRYIEVSLIAAISSCDVIEHLKSHFARHGIPEIITSNNGPQFPRKNSASLLECTPFNMSPVLLGTNNPMGPQSVLSKRSNRSRRRRTIHTWGC